MRFLINILVSGLAIFIAAWILPSNAVTVENFWWALLAGFIIGFVNATLGTILRVFTLPLNLLTLGLVSFIITILMVMLTSAMMGDKFHVNGFWWATLFAVIVAVVEVILSSIFGTNKRS
ncbi:MAG TPA: phage holin family protein [Sphingobacteriaceae bacterium]|nr:phage holin family protein [Sphingobacteriaceae bacterium]